MALMFCHRFNFGKSPPKLSNFNSFKDSAKTDDAMVAIEADISWHSDIVRLVIACVIIESAVSTKFSMQTAPVLKTQGLAKH